MYNRKCYIPVYIDTLKKNFKSLKHITQWCCQGNKGIIIAIVKMVVQKRRERQRTVAQEHLARDLGKF